MNAGAGRKAGAAAGIAVNVALVVASILLSNQLKRVQLCNLRAADARMKVLVRLACNTLTKTALGH